MKKEVHLFLEARGHITSLDCWCEPSAISMDDDDLSLVFIEHNDADATDPLTRHCDDIIERHTSPDWVTKFLNSIPMSGGTKGI